MASLYFDGDLRRIYEVPTGSTFTTDGDGYRIYSGPGEADSRMTGTYLWSRWVDWHAQNKWAELAFEKSGGAFRFTLDGNDVFATFDLRLTNGWALVPANYPHNWTIQGNLFPNDLDVDFDADRITSPGVSSRIFFADSLQVIRVVEGSGDPVYPPVNILGVDIEVPVSRYSVAVADVAVEIQPPSQLQVEVGSPEAITIELPKPTTISHGC